MLYRIASILLLLFDVGHTLGFRQSDPKWGVDALLASMRSIHFDVQGFSRTYWDLFVGAGLFVSVFLSIRSGISVAAGRPSGRNFGGHARHSMGACPLLCRRDDFELDILLHLTYHFLNPDYCVFDCCGMALREANLRKPFCHGDHRAHGEEITIRSNAVQV